jgi:predicted nucleotidyltransferase
MRKPENRLAVLLAQRLAAARYAGRHVDQASEVIVFGSMSAGLERPNSDLDVLCIGDCEFKLKTDLLDLIVLPSEVTHNGLWLQSELATHVGKYGVWIGGASLWRGEVRVGQRAIDEKRRRISAFINSLQNSWFKLDPRFLVKYSVKLRRETQRLLLLEREIAVPPTRILDNSWESISISRGDISTRLREFALNAPVRFVDDLLARVTSDMENRYVSETGFSVSQNQTHVQAQSNRS